MEVFQSSLFSFECKEFSYSAIADFFRCPLRYKYKYLDKIIEDKKPSFYFQIGGLLHRILANYHRTKNPNEKSYEFMLFELSNDWSKIRFNDYQEKEYWWEKVKLIARNFLNEEQKHNNSIIAIELSFNTNIDEFSIKGIIDRIDKNERGEYEIIDYKLGHDVLNPEITTYEDNIQAYFYYLGLSKSKGIKPKRLFYYLLISNSIIEVNFTEQNISTGAAKIISLMKEINLEKDFKPKKNVYCQDCLYPCPLFPNRVFTY